MQMQSNDNPGFRRILIPNVISPRRHFLILCAFSGLVDGEDKKMDIDGHIMGRGELIGTYSRRQ